MRCVYVSLHELLYKKKPDIDESGSERVGKPQSHRNEEAVKVCYIYRRVKMRMEMVLTVVARQTRTKILHEKRLKNKRREYKRNPRDLIVVYLSVNYCTYFV